MQNNMKIQLAQQTYSVVDTIERITMADSVVDRSNKIGSGNGEAKLYVGQEGEQARAFWGASPFAVSAVLLRSDLMRYLDETQVEYLHPTQDYQYKDALPSLWAERRTLVESLPEVIHFSLKEQAQIAGPRLYVKSSDDGYKLLRLLSLPNISFVSVVRLLSKEHQVLYYFRLFADYGGSQIHPYTSEIIANEQREEEQKSTNTKGGRKGQALFRARLLEECPYCPITSVADDRLLIASHIKPWQKASEEERIDPKNGLLLTPTMDRLFDQGFMSFSEDRRLLLSPFLSPKTYEKLGLKEGKSIPLLPIEGRSGYLEYHRTEILKR